ncbi:MAG TPA: HAD-IB family phosphatase [Longimicrobiales bacterium]
MTHRQRFGTVVFDCDSTLSTIEGIEELAAEHRAEIAALTEAAMRGEVPLEEVYGRRLQLVRPTRAQLDAIGRRYLETLVPDARETIQALRREGIQVRIVSGGLRPAVLALASALGVEDEAVAAVDIYFDDAGRYAGFDASSPLACSGGKREILARWADRLPRPVMLVGDGATDLEARPLVDLFVAFAGVVERPPVTAAADVVVRTRSLAPILPLALGGQAPSDAADRGVFERGLEMLQPLKLFS